MNRSKTCGNFPPSCTFCVFWCSSLLCLGSTAQYDLYSARIVVNYTDPNSGVHVSNELSGRFGVSSPTETEVGKVVHVLTDEEKNHGCSPAVNAPASGIRWIALIQRGNCKFEHKIATAARKNNASAVVIYNHVDEDILITMNHSGESCLHLSSCL